MEEQNELTRRMLLASALAAAISPMIASSALAQETEKPKLNHADMHAQLKMGSEKIAIFVYPEFTVLDVIGPHYALAGMMGAQVKFVAKTKEPVIGEGAKDTGVRIQPTWDFNDCPNDLDLLLIPGGLVGTMAAIQDKSTLQFVADRGGKAKLAGSVCTGSLILGAAGLLKDRKATSHWQTTDLLKECGATPVHERIVFDGNDRVTAAGVSAGIDLGLTLVQKYRGDFYAKGMQLLAEYDPQPPFPKGGNPSTADANVVALLQGMHAPVVEQFREYINKAKELL